jgi:hypothetical protein
MKFVACQAVLWNMTVLEATSRLFKFFSEGEYFEMGEHFKDVVLISEDRGLEEAIVGAGLDALEDMGVTVKKESKDKVYWILKKPLAYYEQKVEVAPDTALHIATVLNEVCEKLGNVNELCDPTSITDKDLANLVTLANGVFSAAEGGEKK